MFASVIAIAQTKTDASSANSRTLQRASLAGQGSGRGAAGSTQSRQRPQSNQATLWLLAQQALSRAEMPSLSPEPPLPGNLQPKLEIGSVNDPLEHEADRIADQVMRMPDPTLAIPIGPSQISQNHNEAATPQTMSAKTPGTADGEAPGIVYEALRSPGQPLDTNTRAFFEPRFSYDFSRVRLHTDDRAATAAAKIHALAYAVGSHIVFSLDAFQPSTHSGRRVLNSGPRDGETDPIGITLNEI
jgi:hypothetical protein